METLELFDLADDLCLLLLLFLFSLGCVIGLYCPFNKSIDVTACRGVRDDVTRKQSGVDGTSGHECGEKFCFMVCSVKSNPFILLSPLDCGYFPVGDFRR